MTERLSQVGRLRGGAMPVAIVLLSGGMDSALALAIAKEEGYEVVALTFDYGQRHAKEVTAAADVAAHYKVREHRIVRLDFHGFDGSALTDRDVSVPQDRSLDQMGGGIPPTYVPGRNTIFLAYALAIAEVERAQVIVIGANHLDAAGYPDCRPRYYKAVRELFALATKRAVEGDRVEVRTPILTMTKGDVVANGLLLRVPFHLTWSCYLGGEKACGRCDACLLRLEGFAAADATDPIAYDEVVE